MKIAQLIFQCALWGFSEAKLGEQVVEPRKLSYMLLDFEDFEAGVGDFWRLPYNPDDIRDAMRVDEFCPVPDWCIRLRDNSEEESSLTSVAIDAAAYDEVKLSYKFSFRRYEDNERMVVEKWEEPCGVYSCWEEIDEHVVGDGIENNEVETNQITINTMHLSDDLYLRFRGDASGDRDFVYIDNIYVSYIPSGTPSPSVSPTTAMPTTPEPTTAMPTTAEPTTAMPTDMPTTAMPTTAAPTTTEGFQLLGVVEDFEDDLGVWEDGCPRFCRLEDNSNWATTGSGSMRVRADGTATALFGHGGVGTITGKSDMKVTFDVKSRSVEEHEGFALQWSPDGADENWIVVKKWQHPGDLENGSNNGLVDVAEEFSIADANNTVYLRFRAEPISGVWDRYYFDNIKVEVK